MVTSYNIRDVKYTDTLSCVSVLDADAARRFWSKVDKHERGCWLWTGALLGQNAYGSFSMSRGLPRGQQAPRYAHRISWELAHGPIPPGQMVLHACDVPHCVNPAHLFLGTQKHNMADAAAKGRLSVPRPSARKLTEPQREDIRRRYAAGGVTFQALADEYRVSRPYIWQIVHKRSVEFRARRSA